MSYTMTLDAPERVVSYVKRSAAHSRDELSRLFVDFLIERMGYESEDRGNPFEAFCGTWSDSQFDEFQTATNRTINPEDWK